MIIASARAERARREVELLHRNLRWITPPLDAGAERTRPLAMVVPWIGLASLLGIAPVVLTAQLLVEDLENSWRTNHRQGAVSVAAGVVSSIAGVLSVAAIWEVSRELAPGGFTRFAVAASFASAPLVVGALAAATFASWHGNLTDRTTFLIPVRAFGALVLALCLLAVAAMPAMDVYSGWTQLASVVSNLGAMILAVVAVPVVIIASPGVLVYSTMWAPSATSQLGMTYWLVFNAVGALRALVVGDLADALVALLDGAFSASVPILVLLLHLIALLLGLFARQATD